MRYLLFLAFFFCSNIVVFGQENLIYSKVKILLDESHEINQLNQLGLISEGEYAKGRYFISDFSNKELAAIQAAGFEVEILIGDVSRFYAERNTNSNLQKGQVDCPDNSNTDIITPTNFEFGSMGGYPTYDEILAELDEMKTLYPNLISSKAPISSTLLTHEGREVLWVRISDNPDTNETEEPELLYDALMHAREPASMMQMIYYMWYLLENYETDTEVQYLVDNLEMYFIPCLNPDGYIYNEMTNPNGGGLWRKNRRDNGDGTMGVDLNRNFAYAWAYDDNGSSPNTDSNAYRGPSAFSEPETQLLKLFVENHDFKIALNYHAYSNLLLRPWGHISDLPADIDVFDAFGQLMVEANGYEYGGVEVIGYFANGDSDSYMYGDENIIAMTPEVGSDFWPPTSEIVKDGNANLSANLYTARFLLNYGRATENNSSENVTDLMGNLDFNLIKYGYKTGDLTVSLSSNQMSSSSTPITISLNHLENQNLSFNYELDPSIEDGDEVVFVLNIDNGEHTFQQSFTKIFGENTPADIFLSDQGENMDNWDISTFWGITNARFYSAPTSIADSPQGDYQSGSTTTLALSNALDLTNATEAYITFKSEWNIETNYDYCQLQASTETTDFEGLCGLFTKSGSVNQDEGEPVWDGTKGDWVTEKLLLDNYLGESEVNLRFRLVADNFVTGDGFFFDDFYIIITNDTGTNTHEFTADDFIINSYPNPVNEQLNIELYTVPENGKIIVYNTQGQELINQQIIQNNIELNTKILSQGMYFYSVFSDNELMATRKIIIQ